MIMRVLLYFFLVVLLIQCETPTDEVEETNSIESYCITGDCIVKLYTEENPDENGNTDFEFMKDWLRSGFDLGLIDISQKEDVIDWIKVLINR